MGASAGESAREKKLRPTIHRAPVALVGSAVVQQRSPTNLGGRRPGAPIPIPPIVPTAEAATAATHLRDPVDMRLLLLAADGRETDYASLRAVLDQLGVPYDVLLAAETPLTRSRLWDGVSHGYYQGILLTTGNLTYLDAASGEWRSALDETEWKTLWEYEAEFGIRQVTSYTYPEGLPDDYGLDLVGYQDTSVTPLQATLTPAGQSVFSYLRPAPITIRHAWVYLATVEDPQLTTPLLVTPGGHPIASVTRYPDGRENLAVTAANNTFIRHSQLLSYGLINWVTKGLFIGERHVNVDVQVDDLLIDSDIWNPVANSDQTGITYRMSHTDYTVAASWQALARGRDPAFASLTLELAFNGEGASGIYRPDTLTPFVRFFNQPFAWVNHTYTHLNLDDSTYAASLEELQRNHQAAQQLRLGNYASDALVQPDISGLGNAQFLQAAFDFGIRYLISDTSRPGWSNPTPNAGFYSSFQPQILIVPRRPTNLFYNLSTPAEFVDEYNFYYGPGGVWAFWPRDQTYEEILDHESDNLLTYMLAWDLDPWMFHQANLRAYDGVHSLLSDLLDATFAKYSAVYALPVRSLTQREVGQHMAERMAFNASGARGVLRPCASLTLTASQSAVVPVTGVAAGTNETYGGQAISRVTVQAGTPSTVPLPAC